MYEKAKKENREGIIIKRIGNYSNYENRRSNNWLKCKFFLTIQLEVIKYEENPKGIRVEDKDGNALQISKDFEKVKELIDKNGKAIINIQYLEKTAENRFRFPSFRGLVEK